MKRLILLLLSGPVLAQPVPPAAHPDCSKRPLVMGCASAANLVAMLANPADLETPQPAVAPVGTPPMLSFERYRTGKTLPLPDVGTDSDAAGATPK